MIGPIDVGGVSVGPSVPSNDDACPRRSIRQEGAAEESRTEAGPVVVLKAMQELWTDACLLHNLDETTVTRKAEKGGDSFETALPLALESREELLGLVGEVGLTLFCPLHHHEEARTIVPEQEQLEPTTFDEGKCASSTAAAASSVAVPLVSSLESSPAIVVDPVTPHTTTTTAAASSCSDQEDWVVTPSSYANSGCKSSLASLTVATADLTTVTNENEEEDPVPLLVTLEPEGRDDLEHCPRILSSLQIRHLHQSLPDSLQMHKWERCFAIGRDGDSFCTFTEACAKYNYTVTVIRTVSGHLMGGFCSRPWRVQHKKAAYYGTGQSFLFASHPYQLPQHSETTSTNSSTAAVTSSSQGDLKIFRWTGSNDYCQLCDTDRKVLGMGGEGDFGWIVQDDFWRGQTGRCKTFGNPPLLPYHANSCAFEVADFEVYGLCPWGFTTPTRSNHSLSWLDSLGASP